MPKSIHEGYNDFLLNLVPTESQRKASAQHRASVEASLRKSLNVNLVRETGSFTHGTGVRNHTDVDILVSLSTSNQPSSSDTALAWVKSALTASFPTTPVRISRPAVVIDFAGGSQRWEVIPAFMTLRGGKDQFVYEIPGANTGWIDTAPAEHIKYVTDVNTAEGVAGGAKKLARLAKAWKYYNDVPISSFYLEMQAARWMTTQKSFLPAFDVAGLFEHLARTDLAAMNDPKNVSGRFHPCSSAATKTVAVSKINTAATRARKAVDAHLAEDPNLAFAYLNLLFGGKFPSR